MEIRLRGPRFHVSQSGVLLCSRHELSWLFQDIQKRFRTVNAVAFCCSGLLHNSKLFQSLNATLRCGKGDAELFGTAGDGDERVRAEQLDDPQGRLGATRPPRSSARPPKSH